MGHFVPASMSQSRPFELHVMAWCEKVLTANISLSHYEFHPDRHVHVYFGNLCSEEIERLNIEREESALSHRRGYLQWKKEQKKTDARVPVAYCVGFYGS